MTPECMTIIQCFNEIQAKGENEGGKFLYSNSLEKVAKSSFLLHCLSVCCWTNVPWIGTFRSVFIFEPEHSELQSPGRVHNFKK